MIHKHKLTELHLSNIRYFSGSIFELLYDSPVIAVCHDSNVFLVR